MSFLIEYKWWVLLISETVAWIATFYMAYSRYWRRSNFQFIVSGAIAIITGYVPHITLGILDYLKYNEIHFFSGFVLLLLLLGVTVLKKYVVKIDNKIKDWANKKHQKAAQLMEKRGS
jgi:hypothetical protein